MGLSPTASFLLAASTNKTRRNKIQKTIQSVLRQKIEKKDKQRCRRAQTAGENPARLSPPVTSLDHPIHPSTDTVHAHAHSIPFLLRISFSLPAISPASPSAPLPPTSPPFSSAPERRVFCLIQESVSLVRFWSPFPFVSLRLSYLLFFQLSSAFGFSSFLSPRFLCIWLDRSRQHLPCLTLVFLTSSLFAGASLFGPRSIQAFRFVYLLR